MGRAEIKLPDTVIMMLVEVVGCAEVGENKENIQRWGVDAFCWSACVCVCVCGREGGGGGGGGGGQREKKLEPD